MYHNKTPLAMSEFDGSTATYDNGAINVRYTLCVPEVRDCPSNRQGVHELDLSELHKANYFDSFMDTHRVIHLTKNDVTIEAEIVTTDKDMQPLSTVTEDVYKTMDTIKFENIEEAAFTDKVIVKGNGNRIVVRDTNIAIPGVLAVSKDTKNCTQQVNIGDITVMMYESKSFKFYQYGEILIKIGKTYNIEDYITLK